MKKIKKPLLFALACIPVALLGGFFVLQYQLELFPPETVQKFISQAGSQALLIVIGLIETTVIVVLAAFFGRILADKLGLWKPFRFGKKQLQKALLLSACAKDARMESMSSPSPLMELMFSFSKCINNKISFNNTIYCGFLLISFIYLYYRLVSLSDFCLFKR